MEVIVRQGDGLRVQTCQNSNYIDIAGMENEQGIRVTAHPYCHYIEVRIKQGQLATFYFRNKGAKKHLDLGWWQDAGVVFAQNDVLK